MHVRSQSKRFVKSLSAIGRSCIEPSTLDKMNNEAISERLIDCAIPSNGILVSISLVFRDNARPPPMQASHGILKKYIIIRAFIGRRSSRYRDLSPIDPRYLLIASPSRFVIASLRMEQSKVSSPRVRLLDTTRSSLKRP